MKTKLKLYDRYNIEISNGKVIINERYALYTNGINYKIFVENSKIRIIKEIDIPFYVELSEEEVEVLLTSLQEAVNKRVLDENSTIVFTGAPTKSVSSTIINLENEESYNSAKQLIKHKEKKNE